MLVWSALSLGGRKLELVGHGVLSVLPDLSKSDWPGESRPRQNQCISARLL